jgi:coenzyme F420 biosynthesis associated uncharacterized protein
VSDTAAPTSAAPDAIDWDLALRVGTRLGGSGPVVPAAQAREAVLDLRLRAAQAVGHVAEFTGLVAPPEVGPAVVVDRPRWIAANLSGLRPVIEPVVARARTRRGGPGSAAAGALPRIAGAELGAAMGFLSGKVLGQYELFVGPDTVPRLMFVAPNIVAVEQRLDVDPRDFRLWVALHEETHRVQFGAVAWLGPWLRAQIDGYLGDPHLDPRVLTQRLRQTAGALAGVARGLDMTAVMQALLTPEQRATMDRLTAVMSLLEGHADVVMDGVGRDVVPSVDLLRLRLQERREDPAFFDGLIRRLIGLDAKMQQYRDGAAFVRAVVAQVGMAGFNTIWTSPETLPTHEELHDPQRWLRRVP